MDGPSNAEGASALERLPEEILREIFAYFCMHCMPPPLFNDHSQSDQAILAKTRRAGSRVLRSLCLTSRRIRSIAMPVFLHDLPIFDSLRSRGLYRELQLHPPLGHHIKTVNARVIPVNRESDWQFFITAAQKLLASTGQQLDVAALQQDPLAFNTLPTEVLMLMAPRAVELSVAFWPDNKTFVRDRCGDFSFLSKRLNKVGDGTGFENLRCLRVRNAFSLPSFFTIPLVSALLRVAVNLTHLRLDSVMGLPPRRTPRFRIGNAGPTLQRLKVLEISHMEGRTPHAEFDALREILKLTKNLEKFKFNWMSRSPGHEPGPRIAQALPLVACLPPLAKTLKHLTLIYSDEDPIWGKREGVDLSSLEKLETLELNHVLLCRCHLQDESTGKKRPIPRMAQLLPASVKQLCIQLKHNEYTGCKDCILGLAQKVANKDSHSSLYGLYFSHRYPNEKNDVLDHLQPRLDDFVDIFKSYHEAFRGTGVSLNFDGAFFTALKAARISEMTWMRAQDV